MIYLITYISDNEKRTLEWVTPKGWSPVEIAKCFAERFPDAKLLGMAPVE
jgi:putative exporter of polyketide antibiotics